MCNQAFADASYGCFYGPNAVFIRRLKLFQQTQREQKSVRGDIDGTPEAIETPESDWTKWAVILSCDWKDQGKEKWI